MEFLLSWVVTDKGGHIDSFNWDFLKKLLTVLKSSYGSVTLSIVNRNVGPTSLQVQAENNNYLLTLVDETEDEVEVKSYFNSLADEGEVEILGNVWEKKQISRDYQWVLNMFSQFYETGDVNRDLLR